MSELGVTSDLVTYSLFTGNAGIGAAFVRALAAHNPDSIYLCARTQSSAESTVQAIKKTHPKANIDIFSLDLNSFESVKHCAAAITTKAPRLDYIFLNAGISATSPALTKEGYETQFGINHMGHALFLQLLMPTILTTKKAHPDADIRILLTSSIAARRLSPDPSTALKEMKTPAANLHAMARYGNSKLANVLFARKLAKLYPSLTIVSHHPGTVKTEIWGKATDLRVLVALTSPIVWATGISVDEGAKSGLWTAFAGKEVVKSGAYYEPVGREVDVPGKFGDGNAEELWEWTNRELEGHGGKRWPEA